MVINHNVCRVLSVQLCPSNSSQPSFGSITLCFDQLADFVWVSCTNEKELQQHSSDLVLAISLPSARWVIVIQLLKSLALTGSCHLQHHLVISDAKCDKTEYYIKNQSA